MSDNILFRDKDGATVTTRATDNAGVKSIHHIIETLEAGVPTPVSAAAPLPVEVSGLQTDALTDTQLRATPVVTKVGDGTDTAEIQTGAVNSEKGLRVFIGPTDPISDLPVFVDFGHHQVHEGETYKALHKNVTGSVSPPTTQEYSVTVGAHTPTIHAPHMLFGFSVYDGAIQVDIYENPTGTATGTTITAYNHNRNSTNAPTAVVKHTVTGLSAGTLIDSFYVAAGAKSSDDRATSEWLLKVSTTYRIVVTPKVNASNYVANFNWYEDLGV